MLAETPGASDELTPQMVRERFQHARRRGLANWLWPDLTIPRWRIAMADICRALQSVLAGNLRYELKCQDAQAMGIAGYTSGMGPLLGHWLELGRLFASPEVEATMRKHIAHGRQRMSQLASAGREVADALSAAGITPLIFKGMHTAFSYFPEPGTRPVADIDIHIPAPAMALAEQTLSGLGYSPTLRWHNPYMCDWTIASLRAEPRTLTYVHRDDPWALDVQASLNRRLLTGVQVKLDALMAGAGFDAWPVTPSAEVLRHPLLLLQLAAHASQIPRNLNMIRLFELVQVIRQDTANGRLDWHDFLVGAQASGGAKFFYPALNLCNQLQPGVVPASVMEFCHAASPPNLRKVVGGLSPADASALDRHSLRERFMWASNMREYLAQFSGELAFEKRGRPFSARLYSLGTKIRALRRIAG